MSKKLTGIIKLQIVGAKANPAPPIGPALGQKQVNIAAFCKEFNDVTKNSPGIPFPVIISVYSDKSFSFVVKKPPVSYYIKKLAGIESGSKKPGLEVICKIKRSDIIALAQEKMCDMNCYSVDSAVEMFIGSARSMGIEVID